MRAARVNAYRSAQASELENADNPFRRPVRPEDFDEMVHFEKPLTAQTMLDLGGLLSHRLLLNVYESDYTYLAESGSAPVVADDGRAFYGDEARITGETARPHLESFVFGFLEDEIPAGAGVGNGAALRVEILKRAEAMRARPCRMCAAVEGAHDRARAARMFAIQLAGAGASRPAALCRGLFGEFGPAQQAMMKWAMSDRSLGIVEAAGGEGRRALLRSCGLNEHLHAHWQFYLTSAMAVTTFLHSLGRHHNRLPEFIGAWLCERVHFAAFAPRWAGSIANAIGTGSDVRWLTQAARVDLDSGPGGFADVVQPLLSRLEPDAAGRVLAGWDRMARLWDLAEEDFHEQIRFADNFEEYLTLARQLSDHLESNSIEVDLETFVEPREMCSTTHVHTEDRLIVIESGTMEFWNAYGNSFVFNEGDRFLVPRFRLHGSTILTESCTYHQPIITPEIMNQVVGAT